MRRGAYDKTVPTPRQHASVRTALTFSGKAQTNTMLAAAQQQVAKMAWNAQRYSDAELKSMTRSSLSEHGSRGRTLARGVRFIDGALLQTRRRTRARAAAPQWSHCVHSGSAGRVHAYT